MHATSANGSSAAPVAAAMRGFGLILRHCGEHARSVAAYEASLATWDSLNESGKCYASEASLCRHALAEQHRARGNHAIAHELLERILKTDGAVASPDKAATLHELGNVLHAQGDLQGAQAHWAESQSMVRAVLVAEGRAPRADMSAALQCAGRIAYQRGRGYEPAAISYFRAALQEDCALHGHAALRPERAVLLAELGFALREYADFESATTVLEAALTLWRRLLPRGPSPDGKGTRTVAHPMVAACLQALGIIARDVGEYTRARGLLEAALEQSYALHGEGVPCHAVANTLIPLCVVLRKQGEELLHAHGGEPGAHELFEGACEGLRVALEMYRALLDEPSQPSASVAVALHELAMTMPLVEDTPEIVSATRAYLEEALQIYHTLFEKSSMEDVHPDVAQTFHDLGITLHNQGGEELQQSRKYFEMALELRRCIYGEEGRHPSIAASLLMLGQLCALLGDWDGAYTHCQEALTQLQRTHAEAYDMHSQVKMAREIFEEARVHAEAARVAAGLPRMSSLGEDDVEERQKAPKRKAGDAKSILELSSRMRTVS